MLMKMQGMQVTVSKTSVNLDPIALFSEYDISTLSGKQPEILIILI